jgi:hypothetical protein
MDEQKTSSDSSSSSSSSAAFQQSLPLCIGFAVFSGLLRVCATMVLAYPDFLEKKRIVAAATEQSCHRSDNLHTTTTFTPTFTTTREHPNSRYYFFYVVAHLFILVVAAIVSIISTLYGPVSIAVPVQTGSALLCNVVAMGIVLKMRAFNKAQRTGTYVVFFSILELLDVVGPGVQEGQDALQLLSKPIAMLCTVVVTCMVILATIGTIQIVLGNQTCSRNENFQNNNYTMTDDDDDRGGGWFQRNATITLAIGVTMSNVGMASSSKSFASLQGVGLFVAIIYYLFTAFAGVLFSVVSSTACDQGSFTPMSAVALILTNMVTGIIIWDDWKVLTDTWLAYVCACFLMVCGVYLLAEMDLFERYGRKSMAHVLQLESPSLNMASSLLLLKPLPPSQIPTSLSLSSSLSALEYIPSPEQPSAGDEEVYDGGSIVLMMNKTDPINNNYNNNKTDETLEVREASSFRSGTERRNNSTTGIESPFTAAWCSMFIRE